MFLFPYLRNIHFVFPGEVNIMVNPNRDAAWRGAGAGGGGEEYVNGRGGGPSTTTVQAPTTTTSTNVDNVSNGTTVVSNRGGVVAPLPRGGRGFYPRGGGSGGGSRGSDSWDRGRGVPRGGFRGGFRSRGRGSFAAPLSSLFVFLSSVL